ncbi:hypothetical protein KFK09_003010 [Dendrobium nobile]|uniref:tRNA-intron lyase n=1 Tax=Dendrobium nobile TaxID=94219 RepID=A0A8T3C7X2_DENNO|nr:hypothetical protein KFK09_003010 [Dendrobium nobile]
MEPSGSRWKGKGFADIAAENPMSEIVRKLKYFLTQSKATAMLSGCVSLLEAKTELADLLNRSCFGRQITTSEKANHWFQLSSEETFYMLHDLQSLTIINQTESPLSELELWNYMKVNKETFPELYMAYAHLRRKNWVVRTGAQYGADFVAYRHHPALVHSDYAVVVLQEGDGIVQKNGKLRAWSDLQCSLRVSGSVAKTLLVLFVNRNGSDGANPSCLQHFSVEERTISRWVAEQCREDDCLDKGCRHALNE